MSAAGADCVVIGHGPQSDLVTKVLIEVARRRGIIVASVSASEFVSSVSASLHEGTLLLTDDRPLLIRTVDFGPLRNPEAEFFATETAALLRAYGFATASVVINRPSALASSSWLSPTAIVRPPTGRAAGWNTGAELFAVDVPVSAGWEVQDFSTLRYAYSPARPEGSGPYRLRQGAASDFVVEAVVVGGAVWVPPVSPQLEQAVTVASVDVAGQLQLLFAVMSWRIGADEVPRLARVDSVPTYQQVAGFGDSIPIALIDLLLS